jgi:hypothetical protein
MTDGTVITTHESFWAHLYLLAVHAWHTIARADAEVTAVVAAHPEIIAVAGALEKMASPQVVAGINVAEQVAAAVNNIAAQVASAKA